jgi:hypothetical protein
VKCEDSATPCCRIAILFPIAWTLFLLLAFPAVEVLGVEARVVMSAVTILAFVVLLESLKGWRHILAMPVWLAPALTLHATWVWPIWTPADGERARRERQRREVMRHSWHDPKMLNNTPSPKGDKNP